MTMQEDIAKAKRTLINKAKKSGITENFGQSEVTKLIEKYGYKVGILELDHWCWELDLKQIMKVKTK